MHTWKALLYLTSRAALYTRLGHNSYLRRIIGLIMPLFYGPRDLSFPTSAYHLMFLVSKKEKVRALECIHVLALTDEACYDKG